MYVKSNLKKKMCSHLTTPIVYTIYYNFSAPNSKEIIILVLSTYIRGRLWTKRLVQKCVDDFFFASHDMMRLGFAGSASCDKNEV